MKRNTHLEPPSSFSSDDKVGRVANYYDNFSFRKLIKDLDFLNLRQAEAIRLCRQFIDTQDRVLEIGCGAGIVTRELAKYGSRVTAVDISDTNVRLAKIVVSNPKADIFVCDIGNETSFSLLSNSKYFDVIVMIDVIEHIPLGSHGWLLSNLESLLAPAGRLILTFPSPDYQRYIIENEPEQLQIVDEIVEVGALLTLTALQPVHLRSIDVWRRRQYLHLILQKSGPEDLSPVLQSRKGLYLQKIRNIVWRVRNRKIKRLNNMLYSEKREKM